MHQPAPITARDIGLALRQAGHLAAILGSVAVGLVWAGILS
ncbi:hypothetical protein [Ancylobacter sp. FA202]|nr:hypothetical protein [Ancylobacter sp. FA202]